MATAVPSHAVLDGSGDHDTPDHAKTRFWTLTLGSVGVVYGDIGTSPLYALREALHHAAHDGLDRIEVLGVVSLLLWALIVIVTIKYVLLLVRLDNQGEGGTLSLLALFQTALGRRTALVLGLAIAGTALFYADAAITPAISVLSAVEGLKLVTPVFEPYVVPLTLVILAVLFGVQRYGTASVGRWFGPVTAVWFLAMAVAGLEHIGDDPGVLAAFDPRHALSFIASHGIIGFVVLGSVFLAVTGAEALYADMGHFGRRPIQLAWFVLVFPALALNYLGQGALVLARPEALENPFFLLVPAWALLPMVLLATAATVIASQAVITGAFSLTRQAVQLGLLPRFAIRHTSAAHGGQVYLPRVNRLLLAGVLLLVLLFQTSSALAAAYGIAVTGTMIVSTVLVLLVLHHARRWSLVTAVGLTAPFLAIETAFLAANLLKLHDGGYVPVLVGAWLAIVMVTWARGTDILAEAARKESVSLKDLIPSLGRSSKLLRAPGTAVFLTSTPEVAPAALLHNLKHNHVLHERNVVLTIQTDPAPYVTDARRIELARLGEDFTMVRAVFGYMETPSVPKVLTLCRQHGLRLELMVTSFFLSRRSIRASATYGMPLWQDHLFIGLARAAATATDYYGVPTNRAVELGQQYVV
jgi:KUP system potassium uptake protein